MFYHYIFLFGYVLYEFLQKQKQKHNTGAVTTSEVRCIRFINYAFTMSVTSLYLLIFIINNLMLYRCVVLIQIHAILVNTKAATISQNNTEETTSAKVRMLLRFPFQDILCLC